MTRLKELLMYEDETYGSVIKVFYEKHFGFIEDDKGQKYLFHAKEVAPPDGYREGDPTGFDRIRINDKVRFFAEPHEWVHRRTKEMMSGFRAVRVRTC